MKNKIKAALISLSIILLLPISSPAEMTPLSNKKMDKVTAQEGIEITMNDLGIDLSAETIYYKDKNGIEENSSDSGYLSFNGIEFEGQIYSSSGIQINIGTESVYPRINQMNNVDITMKDFVLHMDRFTIAEIKVGSKPGQGKSFGSFGIRNMRMEISGKIQISAK